MMVFGPKLVLPPPTALTADGSQILLMEFEPNSTTNYTGNNGFSCESTPSLPAATWPFVARRCPLVTITDRGCR